MRRAGTAVALLLACAWPVSPSRAAPDARAVLTAALSGPTAPFSGLQRSEVAGEAGSVVTTVQIEGDGRGAIRRAFRNGPAAGVVLLQAGGAVWQRGGGADWTRLPDAAGLDPAQLAGMIARNYRVTVDPPARLLGRRVLPLRIEPRHPFNPSRRIWLDTATGIALRDELRAPDGRLRSTTVFTALRPGPQPASLFSPPSAGEPAETFGPASFRPLASIVAVERETGWTPPKPGHVPTGYRAVLYGVMTTGSGRKMPAVRYSDGLAAFTVFQRGRGRGPGAHGGRPGGGTHGLRSDVQHAVVEAQGDGTNYLLIGDLAEDELRRVARSLP